jgi:EpsI family protein
MQMLGNMTTRLMIAAALVALVAGGQALVRASLRPPSVQRLSRPLAELPLRFGEWDGEKKEMDPKLAIATGAKEIADRLYTHPKLGKIAVHTAAYDDPTSGVSHTPIYCYRSSGWRNLHEEWTVLPTGGEEVRVKYITWELNNERVRVMYWFQMGEHLIFNRYDLGVVRFKLAGHRDWPTMVKVLIQTPASDDRERDRRRMVDLAEHIWEWLGGLRSTPSATPAP